VIISSNKKYATNYSTYDALIGCKIFRPVVKYMCCARWGVSGALYLQSAIARLNDSLGSPYGWLRAIRRVDNKVLCNGQPRTVSG